MTYQRTETDQLVDQLMKQVEALDPGLAGKLSDAHCDQLTQFENRAVRDHGRSILALIEGTTWAPPGCWSMAYEDESVLVQMMDSQAAVLDSSKRCDRDVEVAS